MAAAANTYPRQDVATAQQLAALEQLSAQLEGEAIPYWLFGGWAVDFYLGSVSRFHDDLDLAVWLRDLPRIAEILEAAGWRHAPRGDEDGGTGYDRDQVRVELTFLVRGRDGGVVTPFGVGPGRWADDAFGDDVGELEGVRARLVSRAWLVRSKRDGRLGADPADEAKDRADFLRLSAPGV